MTHWNPDTLSILDTLSPTVGTTRRQILQKIRMTSPNKLDARLQKLKLQGLIYSQPDPNSVHRQKQMWFLIEGSDSSHNK